MPYNNHNYCLNCGDNFPSNRKSDEEIFCSNCGQSSKDSRLSVLKLIKDGISNIFNLDSRLIHTFRDIIYPAKLTQTYIEGKRKYYVNPVRLFVFMLITLLTMSLWLAKFEDSAMGGDRIYSRAELSTTLAKYDNLVDTIGVDDSRSITDTIRARLFKNIKKPEADSIGLGRGLQLFGMNKDIKNYGISSYDAVHMPISQILTKYKIDDFWDRQYVSTYIRVSSNPANSLTYILKNLTWAVFLTITLMSIFLKLLYIRGNYYIVEHAVLLLNLHSFFFVMLTIGVIINTSLYSGFSSYDGDFDLLMVSVLLLFSIGVQFFAIKKYYKHGNFRALITQCCLNFAYFVIFLCAVTFVAVISVFLY